MNKHEIGVIVAFCRNHLDLRNAKLDQAYFYQSLPLCVIDTVFSIGVRYQSTEMTVRRFCDHFGLTLSRGKQIPDPREQLSINDFLSIYSEYGIQRMADEVYRNHQRTSPVSGILKSEAVFLFSQVLSRFGVNYFQDTGKILGLPEFESEIRQIPGQHSGISLRYFYMLIGSDDFIKPDRMIKRFLYLAMGLNLTDEECQEAIVEACRLLKQEYPTITPRLLDNLIWNYQRGTKSEV
jgi:hypothetical protein